MSGDVPTAPSSHQETIPTQSQPSNGGHWSVTSIQRLTNISRLNFALGTAVLLFALLVLIVLLPDASSRALPIFIAIGSVIVLLGVVLESFWRSTTPAPEEPSAIAVSVYLVLLLLLASLIAFLVLGDLDPIL